MCRIGSARRTPASFLLSDGEPVISRSSSRWLAAAWFLIFWPTLCLCQPPDRGILCRGGSGIFEAEFHTGISVHIGAARDRGLATRACAAKLSWEKQELLVATGAAQLDLDAFGVDLGDGVPVAAFQIKKSDTDCCVDYRIYSLEKPPRLLRTLKGGGFFSAADVDLDGSVEIWTNDGAAIDGFEKLTLSELDSPPTVVFRFEHGRLLDVSAEFQSYFDNEISRTRDEIHSRDLQDFKNGDGQLAEPLTPASAERLHRLRMVKIKILEIVWAYLYSGRAQDAWRSLAEMWPAADLDRIRAAIAKARALGIHSQAEGDSSGAPSGRKKHARIFDAVTKSGAGRSLDVVPPKAILLEFSPTSEHQPPSRSEAMLLDLVIDAAGKVRSAEAAGPLKSAAQDRIALASTWKFIPAFKNGRAVASRLRMFVSPKQ